jgi:hypothetical protein
VGGVLLIGMILAVPLPRYLSKDTDWCPELFLYMTIIRDPIARIVSNSNFHQQARFLSTRWQSPLGGRG